MYVLNTIEEVVSFHLRRLRADRTQAEMAEFLGLPLRSYQALEYGSVPRPETRRIIAEKLGITETQLFLDPDLIEEEAAKRQVSPDHALFVLRAYIDATKKQTPG